jgi:hypothetical protein
MQSGKRKETLMSKQLVIRINLETKRVESLETEDGTVLKPIPNEKVADLLPNLARGCITTPLNDILVFTHENSPACGWVWWQNQWFWY